MPFLDLLSTLKKVRIIGCESPEPWDGIMQSLIGKS